MKRLLNLCVCAVLFLACCACEKEEEVGLLTITQRLQKIIEENQVQSVVGCTLGSECGLNDIAPDFEFLANDLLRVHQSVFNLQELKWYKLNDFSQRGFTIKQLILYFP
jgi:hypothetical protein